MRLEPLISERRIRSRVADIAKRIGRNYEGEPLSLVVALKGAYMFAADLVRRIEIPCTVDFITATSYGRATRSSGRVTIRGIDRLEVAGRRVLVVEDILDTGLTGAAIFDQLTSRKPADIMFCTLLRKPQAFSRRLPVLYKGFDIPDDFVVGYGMDYAERYRNRRTRLAIGCCEAAVEAFGEIRRLAGPGKGDAQIVVTGAVLCTGAIWAGNAVAGQPLADVPHRLEEFVARDHQFDGRQSAVRWHRVLAVAAVAA